MYSVSQFREYVAAGAAGIVQVDVARVGGITPWLKVAHLAETFNLEVCPHFLMELHVSLTAAVPNGRYVEHIPQLRAITRTEMDDRPTGTRSRRTRRAWASTGTGTPSTTGGCRERSGLGDRRPRRSRSRTSRLRRPGVVGLPGGRTSGSVC